MAAPLLPLIFGALAAMVLSGRSERQTSRAPLPREGGRTPDELYGPRVASVPLNTPPPAGYLPAPAPATAPELARAAPVQPGTPYQPPAQYFDQRSYQAPIDRRTAALQLREYLRTHTGARRDRGTVRYYQGLLGTTADGLDGPNTQRAIELALSEPYQQAPQPWTFERTPPLEQAKQSQGGWSSQSYGEQGSGKGSSSSSLWTPGEPMGKGTW